MTEPPLATGMRASDAERRDMAETLQRHHAAGRLSLAELDERLAVAYAARTREQLAALIADLPADPADAPVGAVASGLVCAVWCLCPPVGLAYCLYLRRIRRRLAGASR